MGTVYPRKQKFALLDNLREELPCVIMRKFLFPELHGLDPRLMRMHKV